MRFKMAEKRNEERNKENSSELIPYVRPEGRGLPPDGRQGGRNEVFDLRKQGRLITRITRRGKARTQFVSISAQTQRSMVKNLEGKTISWTPESRSIRRQQE